MDPSSLAPFGILGLVFKTISDRTFASLANYGVTLGLLIATMAFVALIINRSSPFSFMRKNPYPHLFWNVYLRVSGITAFFTRSSAIISLSIWNSAKTWDWIWHLLCLHPLGSTINMAGATVTIWPWLPSTHSESHWDSICSQCRGCHFCLRCLWNRWRDPTSPHSCGL